jgi:hypothetical protein
MLEVKRTSSRHYRQNWTAYNAAQTNEKSLFIKLLHQLLQGIEVPECLAGQLRLPLSDMLLCMILMVYTTISSRRFESELKEGNAKDSISKVPHFNTVLNYMKLAALKPVLQQLIRASSAPLRAIETRFAIDSTGLRVPLRRRYYNRHKERFQMKHDWVKLHVMCGVQTNVITSAEVSDGAAGDSLFFQSLVRDTARYFELSEVYADGAYTSNGNRREVIIWGAEPFIAFRSNSVIEGEPKSTLWKQMLQQFQDKESEFWKHYYQRNNNEATFSMLKRKFDGKLRSKTFPAQVNEALCKVLCHNLCVLIQSMYELGIEPDFHTDVETRQPPHSISEPELTKVRERLAALTVTQPSLLDFVENNPPSQQQTEVIGSNEALPPTAANKPQKLRRRKKASEQVELFS